MIFLNANDDYRAFPNSRLPTTSLSFLGCAAFRANVNIMHAVGILCGRDGSGAHGGFGDGVHGDCPRVDILFLEVVQSVIWNAIGDNKE